MADMFRRVGGLKRGYDIHQVDEFFARAQRVYEGQSAEQLSGDAIRTASFDLVRRGYAPSAVDAALDRLDAAFAAKERDDYVARHGQDGWFTYVADRATTLYGRLTRPRGKRFRAAASGVRGYDREQVDALLDKLVAYFNDSVPLSPDRIRAATFTARKGGKGYDPTSVDAFLDRAVEVLQSAG